MFREPDSEIKTSRPDEVLGLNRARSPLEKHRGRSAQLLLSVRRAPHGSGRSAARKTMVLLVSHVLCKQNTRKVKCFPSFLVKR